LHVRGNAVHAEATHEDMYAAIDLLADKLDRRVIKHKGNESRSSRCRGTQGGR
jgi:putative sigma-54 modulation protein